MNTITNEDIQTTTTLSVPQIQRRTRSDILERSDNGICGKETQYKHSNKWIPDPYVLRRSTTQTLFHCHQQQGSSYHRP